MVHSRILVIAALLAVTACDNAAVEPDPTPAPATDNVLALDILGLSFTGPTEVRSGWTTVRISNNSGMTHHGLVYRLPDGITEEMVSEEVVRPIQQSLSANIAGDTETAIAIMQTIPAWIADFVYMGGPGMISHGVVGETTMYLEPGHYIVECYVKTNGVQHNYNPAPGGRGMVLGFTVTEEPGGKPEPAANVTLAISNTGYTIEDGSFVAGENNVRVRFAEQRLYNNFVGHDAHFFRIDADTDVAAGARWPDFFPLDGQQTPAPVHYVGGIHDMPEGSVAYVKMQLEAGEYGIVAEVPDAEEIGLFRRISVTAD